MNKYLLMTFYYTHRSVSCSALSEKLHPTADRNKGRDPQLDNTQSMRDLETPSSKWDVSIKFLYLELREFFGRQGRKILNPSEDGSHQGSKDF